MLTCIRPNYLPADLKNVAQVVATSARTGGAKSCRKRVLLRSAHRQLSLAAAFKVHRSCAGEDSSAIRFRHRVNLVQEMVLQAFSDTMSLP
jgi:hypothetical protein